MDFQERKSSPPCPSFLVLLEKGRENHQENKDFLSPLNPKIPGKEGKSAQKNKEILARRKNKEFQKTKERKDRAMSKF